MNTVATPNPVITTITFSALNRHYIQMGYRPHTTLPHMKPSPRTTRQYVLPAYWASYLVNGDASGLDPIEREAVDAFLDKWGHRHDECLSVSREFVGRSQHCGLIADVCTYIFSFSPSSGVARPAMGRA